MNNRSVIILDDEYRLIRKFLILIILLLPFPDLLHIFLHVFLELSELLDVEGVEVEDVVTVLGGLEDYVAHLLQGL